MMNAINIIDTLKNISITLIGVLFTIFEKTYKMANHGNNTSIKLLNRNSNKNL